MENTNLDEITFSREKFNHLTNYFDQENNRRMFDLEGKIINWGELEEVELDLLIQSQNELVILTDIAGEQNQTIKFI